MRTKHIVGVGETLGDKLSKATEDLRVAPDGAGGRETPVGERVSPTGVSRRRRCPWRGGEGEALAEAFLDALLRRLSK